MTGSDACAVHRYVARVVRDRLDRRTWIVLVWLLAVGIIAAGSVVTYGVAQQVGRRGADDVPRAQVNGLVTLLSAGASPERLAPSPPVRLDTDASLFVAVYGSDHAVLATTAALGDRVPTVPTGVLDHAATAGEAHVTWQPAPGVREAVVARPWAGPSGSGVVVAGVGLRPVEQRAQQVLLLCVLGCLAGMLLVTVGAGLAWRLLANRASWERR